MTKEIKNDNPYKVCESLLSEIKREINEIRNQDINTLIDFKNINKETILKIIFIWSVFFINIGIFVKKDMCNLFFADIKITKYLLILYFLILVIFKSVLIIKKQKSIVYRLLLYIYIYNDFRNYITEIAFTKQRVGMAFLFNNIFN